MNEIKISKEVLVRCEESSLQLIQDLLQNRLGINSDDYYLLVNGKRVSTDQVIKSNIVHIIARVNGGKGGFGSMLRAIGAQIEKTTNREACRDLSGRRLRDINDEKRIKILMKEKEERKQKAAEKRREKLEKILEGPKIEMMDDREFYDARSKLPDNLEEAISEGLKQSSSNHNDEKRTICSSSDNLKPKKKRKILFNDDEDTVSSTDSEVEDSKSN